MSFDGAQRVYARHAGLVAENANLVILAIDGLGKGKHVLGRASQDSLEAGEVETAIGHFSALIDHAPDFAEAYHRRATAFFRQKEYGLALSDLAEALSLNPNHFEATYGLGVILETLEKPEQAFGAYSRVLETYPTHERALEAVDRLRSQVAGTSL